MQMDASDEAKEWMRFLLMQFHAMQQKVHRWYGDGMEMQIRETRLDILQKELEYQQLLLEHSLQHCMDDVNERNQELQQENDKLRQENEELRTQLRDTESMLAFHEAPPTTEPTPTASTSSAPIPTTEPTALPVRRNPL